MYDHNPKTAAGRAKASLGLSSPTVALMDAAVADLGNITYGENNFIRVPVACSDYLSAVKRHVGDFAAGNDMDEDEPSLHNLILARRNLDIIIQAQLHGTLVDDCVKEPWYRDFRRRFVEANKAGRSRNG